MAVASVSERDRIQFEGRWYVLATSARIEGQLQTLKRDDLFALFDRYGDILPWEGGQQGQPPIVRSGSELERQESSPEEVR